MIVISVIVPHGDSGLFDDSKADWLAERLG